MRRCAPILAVLVLAATAYADEWATHPTGGGQPHTNMQPYLGLNYIIAMDGEFPSRGTWDGRTLMGEVSLFAGNYAPHGWVPCDGQVLPLAQNQMLYSILGTTYGGDGRTSFALPDLRGRIPLHAGTGSGLTPRPLGSRGGADSVTLTEAQMPGHDHTLHEFMYPTLETGGGQSHTNIQPFLALNHTISLEGADPSSAGFGGNGPTFLGEVRRFAGNFVPGGRALCDGQSQGIPDLRGRTPLHAGTGPGLSPRTLGSEAGVEQVTLTEAQTPIHGHPPPPNILMTGNAGGNQPHNNMGPSFVLNHIIALEGALPSPGGSGICEDFMGEITLFAGNYAPDGWALCDGQLLPVTGNEDLFDILGTTYGGDGLSTFALPDLRGRAALHCGTGPGLSPRSLGSSLGVEEVQLAVAELPAHDHTMLPSIVFADGGSYDFDGRYGRCCSLTVWDAYSGEPTGVSVLSGAEVYDRTEVYHTSNLTVLDGSLGDESRDSSGLFAYNASQVEVSGGVIQRKVEAHHTSHVTISDGIIGHDLLAYGASEVIVSGGSIGGSVQAYDESQVIISGGTIGDDVFALESSEVTVTGGTVGGMLRIWSALMVEGSGFSIDGAPVPPGTYMRPGAGDPAYGSLGGIFPGGEAFTQNFEIHGPGKLVLVPEPATLSLLGLGLAAVVVRRRRAVLSRRRHPGTGTARAVAGADEAGHRALGSERPSPSRRRLNTAS